MIDNDLLLLVVFSSLKGIVIFIMASYLIHKWKNQERKYYSDFPFLNALGFYILVIGKIFDIFIYYSFSVGESIDILAATNPQILLICRIRFIISPILVVLPYLILMLIIWLNGKLKIQIFICALWSILSITSVLFADTYSEMLLINQIAAFPIVVITIISFGIIHLKKKLPEINSLLLCIGWIGFGISQIIRPIWKNLGSGFWGLTWIGELYEMFTLIIIGLGFFIPANYSKHKVRKNLPAKFLYQSKI